MTAISNYNSLKSNIQDYHKRGDALAKYDAFIDFCEQDICNGVSVGGTTFALRVKEMDSQATGLTSASDRFVALPAGFLEFRRVRITVDDELYDIPFKDLKNLNVHSDEGVPTQYTLTSQLELNRISDQAYTLTFDYFQKPTALSSLNTTNDILTNYPGIYLHGCLYHAFQWSLQYDTANYWKAQFAASIAAANKTSRRGKTGPGAKKSVPGMVV